MPYKLTVNGRPATVDVHEDTPLLWVIRDVLNLHGTKYGCGMALCGCCTVHLNGEAVRSCTTPITHAAGKHVTTLEGLSEDGTHPVQTRVEGNRRAPVRLLPGWPDDVRLCAAREESETH